MSGPCHFVYCPKCDHVVLIYGDMGKCNVCSSVYHVTIQCVQASPLSAQEIEARRNVNR